MSQKFTESFKGEVCLCAFYLCVASQILKNIRSFNGYCYLIYDSLINTEFSYFLICLLECHRVEISAVKNANLIFRNLKIMILFTDIYAMIDINLFLLFPFIFQQPGSQALDGVVLKEITMYLCWICWAQALKTYSAFAVANFHSKLF